MICTIFQYVYIYIYYYKNSSAATSTGACIGLVTFLYYLYWFLLVLKGLNTSGPRRLQTWLRRPRTCLRRLQTFSHPPRPYVSAKFAHPAALGRHLGANPQKREGAQPSMIYRKTKSWVATPQKAIWKINNEAACCPCVTTLGNKQPLFL